MRESAIRARRWTRKEYDQAIAAGIFREDEPIELIAGRLIVAEPKHPPHAVATELTAAALRTAFGSGWTVRIQEPVALDASSEPEPDVAVVRGEPRDYLAGHPAHPVLVVEIADSSLRLDRGLKARRYARARLADYWIVNLVDRVVEIHRDPRLEGRRWTYTARHIVRPGETLSPLAEPHVTIAVSDLLP